MIEAFLTLVIGLPAFFIQIVSEKERKEWLNDILITLAIIVIIFLLSR